MRNSLDDVVAAALRVLGSQGLEGCSMRRVAAELGVQPSALYHHVPDKQTLLALMADEIVAGVGVDAGPHLDEASPVAAARVCSDLRKAMLAVRDGADVVATAAAFRLGASRVEDELADLVGRDGARTLLLYTFGQAQATQMHRHAAAFDALVAGVEVRGGNGGDRAAVARRDDHDVSFERGLEIILAGLGRLVASAGVQGVAETQGGGLA